MGRKPGLALILNSSGYIRGSERMASALLKVMSSKSHMPISNTHNQAKLKYVFKGTSKESRVSLSLSLLTDVLK